MDTARAEMIADLNDRCGEGPLWDFREDRLLWVDANSAIIHCWDPRTNAARNLSEGAPVSGLALAKSGIIVSATGGIFILRPDGRLAPLCANDEKGEPLVCNDIVAAPDGRVYFGTYHWGDDMIKPGCLYMLDGRLTLTKLDDGIGLANGLGISPDGRTLYFADSAARRIYAYDVSPADGTLSGRRVCVQAGADEGLPDGLTVDAEGFVWSAQWYGGRVVRYDPDGRPQRRVEMPVRQTSSVMFGGRELDELFVTTAGEAWPSRLSPPGWDAGAPQGGALYRVRVGVPGRREHVADLG